MTLKNKYVDKKEKTKRDIEEPSNLWLKFVSERMDNTHINKK